MRILITIGGSTPAEATVRLGARLLRLTGGKATILSAIKHEVDRPQAEAVLAAAVAQMAPAGETESGAMPVQTRIRIGNPADEIVQEAAEGKYDLVVVGARPTYNLLARLIGPTAERVLAQAPCSVIVARERNEAIQRILLCDSGAGNPSLLGRFMNCMSPLLNGKTQITILHVMSQISAAPGVPGWQLRADAQQLIQEQTPEGELLAKDVHSLERTTIQPQPKVRHGLVVDEILDEARSGDYDLIVIGAHRGARWQRLLLDDLAHQIVFHSDRPVLVVQ